MTGQESRKGGAGGPLCSTSSIGQERSDGQETLFITWGPSAAVKSGWIGLPAVSPFLWG